MKKLILSNLITFSTSETNHTQKITITSLSVKWNWKHLWRDIKLVLALGYNITEAPGIKLADCAIHSNFNNGETKSAQIYSRSLWL